MAWLDSPIIDAGGGDEMFVDFYRWVYIGEQGLADQAQYRFEITNDAGANHTVIEQYFIIDPGWNAVSFPIGLSPTDSMRLRFTAEDEGGSIGTPDDVIMETLIDDVTVRGVRYLCDTFSAPAAAPPNPVGNSLILGKHAAGTRLLWMPPPMDTGHDEATIYRVYMSASADTGFVPERTTTDVELFDRSPVDAGGGKFYIVVSENGGGTSGEEP